MESKSSEYELSIIIIIIVLFFAFIYTGIYGVEERLKYKQEIEKITIEIDNCFVVNDIEVVESSRGLFVMMPNKRTPNGDYKDIAHPINQETRELIQTIILKKYEELEGE